jgi:hypothetical protein
MMAQPSGAVDNPTRARRSRAAAKKPVPADL